MNKYTKQQLNNEIVNYLIEVDNLYKYHYLSLQTQYLTPKQKQDFIVIKDFLEVQKQKLDKLKNLVNFKFSGEIYE